MICTKGFIRGAVFHLEWNLTTKEKQFCIKGFALYFYQDFVVDSFQHAFVVI